MSSGLLTEFPWEGEPVETDQQKSERWERLDDDLVREQDEIDRLRAHAE
jgi:hypothetical protein